MEPGPSSSSTSSLAAARQILWDMEIEHRRVEDELRKLRMENEETSGILDRRGYRYNDEEKSLKRKIAGVRELLEMHMKRAQKAIDDSEGQRKKEWETEQKKKTLIEEEGTNVVLEEQIEKLKGLLGIERTLNGPPSCGVCQLFLADKRGQIPRLLGCGHTLCERCAWKLATNTSILCPFCREPTALIDRGVRKLSKNFTLLEHLLCANRENKTN